MKKVELICDILDVIREKFPDKEDVFAYKIGNSWVRVSSASYLANSELLGLGLQAAGLKAGDKVATILGNRPEWNYFDMGIMLSGCIHVPLYPTLSTENFRYIFQDAEIKLLIVGCQAAYNRVKPALDKLNFHVLVYSVDEIMEVNSWQVLLKTGKSYSSDTDLAHFPANITPESLATIIYTSGTTGQPKGVMLSHKNIVSNFIAVSNILEHILVNRALSFLPLSHIYERMLNYMYQYLGISVYYAENFDRIRDNLCEVRPEMFCAVPRIIEKSYAAILRKGRNLSGLRKIVFFWALKLGHNYEFEKAEKLVFGLKLKIADFLVYRKWRSAFGQNIRFIVSGGAPLNPKLARVFWAAGMKVIEGYGLTETSPVIATGNFEPNGVKFGTVGRILPGIEVKLSDEGEILCKGPNVMLGYLNQVELTQAVFDADGWFHTGDVGMLVDGDYLKITDRKKEIFKTSGGKYVAPQVVENRLKESPFIENALVVGENKNFVSALIVPNFEYLKSWCGAKAIPYISDEKMVVQEVVISRLHKEIDAANLELDKPSQVKKFALMHKGWTVESGELSYTMKVRRTYLHKLWADLIAGFYGEIPVGPYKKSDKSNKKRKNSRKNKKLKRG
ncbi:MAG: long-chain fatty acid--CoA ligase [Lentimicrobiaceae bacterium]|nr:long-chain fatty acid--CoA ligase [Lentimicrobiaceae bacterium]MCB9023897.1 long-chain fatty acid--CoA ligase [Lentimicrobiaceae bacterium]